jgi:hypothetical protein
MQKLLLILLLVLTVTRTGFAVSGKSVVASRTAHPPRIDAKLDEPEWQNALKITDFTQFRPYYNQKASFPTEVRILYDDYAIYIGAKMFDPQPDSILHQLGNRDDDDLNTDWFMVQLDTYNNQLDAYTFIITASGVQQDLRTADATFNAVWQSAVNINKEGWTAEIKIPYSAIRFPTVEVQQWGIQISRGIRRYREKCQLALEENGASNNILSWSKLDGINNIKPPLRLSLTPYLSSSVEHYPYNQADKSNMSYSFGGGMDLKYGINESFTLDVTLLPDFSQVQSDNLVKNLSAFETTYNEQRLFFQEAVDLFQKGNIFYSRRIGRIPLHYYDVYYDLQEGEKILKNPYQAKLINATKFSGRNSKGTAFGIFNAVTDNTYATIENEDGSTRKFLTDPRTNYNIVVMDQALKNNSSFYLINTNVTRDKGYSNANVSGTGFTLNNKANTYRMSFAGNLSQIFKQEYTLYQSHNEKFLTDLGYQYGLGLGKVKGSFQWWLARYEKDNKFSANDMGITLYNNETYHYGRLIYNMYEPKGKLRELYNTFEFTYKQNYQTRELTEVELGLNSWGTLLNYLTIWFSGSTNPAQTYDYYEPRMTGKVFLKPRYHIFELGISSDYRKAFALDMSVTSIFSDVEKFRMIQTSIRPIIRINDHLGLNYNLMIQKMVRDIGFAGIQDNTVFFGRRDVDELENTLTLKYLFRNNLSLNLRARHYFSVGDYNKYFELLDDGKLKENQSLTTNPDYNFSVFNIDMVGSWEFAPGSRFEVIWKNSIFHESEQIIRHYWDNIQNTWDNPQLNTFTVKFLYYIDYQTITKRRNVL